LFFKNNSKPSEHNEGPLYVTSLAGMPHNEKYSFNTLIVENVVIFFIYLIKTHFE